MKLPITLLLMVFVFTTCASTNRIMEINDSHKEIKGFKLIQNLKASSSEKTGNRIVNQFFNIRTTYYFEERKNQKPAVTVEFHLVSPIRADELDSVMYLNLDNEKVRVVSSEDKYKEFDKNSNSTTNSSDDPNSDINVIKSKTKPADASQTTASQKDSDLLLTRKFSIPENLWLSIAHSKTIFYRLSIGKKGIDVKLNPAETIQLKKFFNRAMKRRIEIIPLVPHGKVKW